MLQGLLWIVAASGIVAFLLILLCPQFSNRMDEWTTQVQTVPVHIQHCDLVRNGDVRENAVRCTYAYTFQGKQYVGASAAWSNDSPFTTSKDLARALDAESRIGERRAHVHRYAPDHAELIDERWIVAPPLWLILGLLFIACMAASIALTPSVHHREDLVYQPAGGPRSSERGQLVEAPGRWTRNRTRRMIQTFALGCATVLCLYGLTNRPDHVAHTAALTDLQPIPTRLTACNHRWHGTTKGNDEINCGFEYVYAGKTYSGRAEAMDFRLFPTDARMDAQVRQVMLTPSRMAYVDPQHPTYAWAYINNDWIVPYSWGIFEAMVGAILFFVLPILLKETLFPKD